MKVIRWYWYEGHDLGRKVYTLNHITKGNEMRETLCGLHPPKAATETVSEDTDPTICRWCLRALDKLII